MNLLALGRWRAAGAHLAVSLAIVAAVAALELLLWYPGPLFVASDGAKLLAILAGLMLGLGPLLTLLVYKPGKPGLESDLWVIGFVQVVALAYSLYVIALARPVYIVFIKDRFDVATAADLPDAALATARYPEFGSLPWTGPQFVAADMPTEPAARHQIIEAALEGRDLQHFPSTYVPYAERRQAILAQALTVARLRATEPQAARAVDEYLTASGVGENRVRALMLLARSAWVVVLVDADSAAPVRMLPGERIGR